MKRILIIALAAMLLLACTASAEVSLTTGRNIDHANHEIAVQLDNEPGARPQKGIGSADIVYEVEVYNGGYTRYTAIFNDTVPELVEAVRSARIVNADIMMEYSGILVHFGGQKYAGSNVYEYFQRLPGVVSVDGIVQDGGKLFYRDKSRKAPNNVICILPSIVERVNWANKPEKSPLTFNAQFTVPAAGENVNSFRIAYRDKYTASYQWDASIGRYLRFYGDNPFIDGLTNEQVKVDNVIVQSVEYSWFSGESDRPNVKTVGSNSCEYFIGGKHFSGYWKRDDVNSNTVYYDNDGNVVAFNPGVTFIQLLKTEKAVEITG
ncbi:MAG: DUF3048 domain-containing protein [Clostridia bacterium]|nr:DUF3048 domain-containing protein [Clostridia bacterium]